MRFVCNCADDCAKMLPASCRQLQAGSLCSPDGESCGGKPPLTENQPACQFPTAFYRESMSEHKVTLTWRRGDMPFEYQKYPRDHTWKFDGGHEMVASAAPTYLGNPKNVDPEEAFVASLSSCHMLTFLAVAAKKKFVLDEYTDEAVGHMEKNTDGKLAITSVTLKPRLKFSGEKQPNDQELDEMHHAAHDQCFIANSVKTEVTVEKQ
jgi:organic hydroperoxide reductase OsmC/OhrA